MIFFSLIYNNIDIYTYKYIIVENWAWLYYSQSFITDKNEVLRKPSIAFLSLSLYAKVINKNFNLVARLP